MTKLHTIIFYIVKGNLLIATLINMSDDEYEYDYGSDEEEYQYGSDADEEDGVSDQKIEIENLFYGKILSL